MLTSASRGYVTGVRDASRQNRPDGAKRASDDYLILRQDVMIEQAPK